MDILIRPFDPTRDYAVLEDLEVRNDPRSASTADSLRFRDEAREPRVKLVRLIADLPGEGSVGMGRLMHIWWAYHPDHYQMRILVDPRWRRNGIGSALFERLMLELEAWRPELVRAEARSSLPEAMAFLEHRGFTEWRRRSELILQLQHATTAPLEAAAQRAYASGVRITTFAEELPRRGASLRRAAYDVDVLFSSDEPAAHGDSGADPMSFERFAASQLDGPEALPDAHFIAWAGDQIVGVSRLNRHPRRADILRQDLTGVHREYRGRGIAQALKLRTVEYARAHGCLEIDTSNDAANDAMVHINETLGFRPEPPVIIYERRFRAETA